MAGFSARRSAYRMRSRAGTSPRRFEYTTWETRTRSSKTWRPAGLPRSSERLRLLRLKVSKKRLSSPAWPGGTDRDTSPPAAGSSILITPAPRAPSWSVPKGPAPYCSRARMRTSASGLMSGTSRAARGSLDRRRLAEGRQRRGEIPDTLQAEDGSLQRRHRRRREREAGVPAELGGDVRRRQRVLGSALLVRAVRLERPPIPAPEPGRA